MLNFVSCSGVKRFIQIRYETGLSTCLYFVSYFVSGNIPGVWNLKLFVAAGLPPRSPGFDAGSVHVGFVVDKVALGQVFSPSTSVFPCQFHSICAPLLGKGQKNNHHHRHHHRVAQEASMLRCVRSVCCGALHRYCETKRHCWVVNILAFYSEVHRFQLSQHDRPSWLKLRDFPQSFQVNTRILRQIRPQPIPSKFFLIYWTLNVIK
jgi:hypothetical protein